MCYSYLGDPSRVYSRVLKSISMALGCLGKDNNLVVICGAVVLY